MKTEASRANGRRARTALAIVGILLFPAIAHGVRGVVNVNQHKLQVVQLPCPSPPPPPPFPILSNSPFVSAASYHPGSEAAIWATARCVASNLRPRIYSDDSGFDPGNATQKQRILEICSDINDSIESLARGVEHYEHWEKSLSDQGNKGQTLGGYNTWYDYSTQPPTELDARDMIRWFGTNVRDTSCSGMKVGSSVVPLTPNGALARGTGSSQRQLKWNGNPATLIGFGWMGALAAGDRAILVRQAGQDGLLGTLRAYGANLFRIFAVEQWTARAICPAPHGPEGLTPFSGVWGTYDLSVEGLNPAYFKRLRELAQLAADRGIVVQLSVFDKHGVINPHPPNGCHGRWFDSPYNKDANNTYFLDGSSMESCDCNPCGPARSVEVGDDCTTLDDFLNSSNIVPIHDAFIKRVAQEVGGTGNMIFEIMNEMNAATDWPGLGEDWQGDYVACLMEKELPVFVARDAFNDEAADQGLANKAPDAGTGNWTAANTLIYRTQDPETSIQMGAVRGRTDATGNLMRGALALNTVSPRSELGVRAKVSVWGSSAMELGFSASPNPTGDVLRVEVGTPMIMGACNNVSIKKRINGQLTTIASTCIQVNDRSDLHFLVDVTTATARVFLDSAPISQLSGVSVGTLPSNLNYAFFRGSKPSGFYRDTDGEIDDFEAAIYYRDPAYACEVPQ